MYNYTLPYKLSNCLNSQNWGAATPPIVLYGCDITINAVWNNTTKYFIFIQILIIIHMDGRKNNFLSVSRCCQGFFVLIFPLCVQY